MADLSPLVGTEVRQIRLDYQVTLLLVDGPPNDRILVDGPAGSARVSAVLQVECPFRLEADGGDWVVEPGDKGSYPPICRLIHLTIASADMDPNETLRLGFSDGSKVTVERHEVYESWNLTGKGVPEVFVQPL